MVEVMVVAAIVAAALLYAGRRVWKLAAGKSRGCGKCGGDGCS